MVMLATPASYVLFFPSIKPKRKLEDALASVGSNKRIPDWRSDMALFLTITSNSNKGFLNNSVENVLPPDTSVTVNPCYEHLRNGICPHQGSRFSHGIFPRNYTKPDRIIMSDWVGGTPSLSWKPAAKVSLDHLQASDPQRFDSSLSFIFS